MKASTQKTHGTSKRTKTKARTTRAARVDVAAIELATSARMADHAVNHAWRAMTPEERARAVAPHVGPKTSGAPTTMTAQQCTGLPHVGPTAKSAPETPKRTEAEKAEIRREELRGLVDEAVAHVAQVAMLFACSDAELDSGEYCGSPPERREQFNHAIAGIVAGLDCIRHVHASDGAVTS